MHGNEAEHLSTFSVNIKNAWNNVSTFRCAFLEDCISTNCIKGQEFLVQADAPPPINLFADNSFFLNLYVY
jgi:hypothetical protein